jgi:hypothetical protein
LNFAVHTRKLRLGGLHMRYGAAICLACSLLAGCASVPLKTDGKVGAEEVMRRVKDELSQYYYYMHQHENDPALANACKGRIGFKIKSVAVTLTSVADDTSDVNGSASLPVGAAGTFGPSLDLTGENKSTSTMKYTFYPVDPGSAKPTLETDRTWSGFPIASSLEGLRESLLKASDTLPCETFTAPAADGKPAQPADQSVTFDFTVTHTAKGGATFKFVLFSAGATLTHQRQSGNNVVVTFNAMPGAVGID